MATHFEDTYTSEEWQQIDTEFSRLSLQHIHYLDHAGAALYSEHQVKDSYDRLKGNLYCNPHTNQLTEQQVDEVRAQVLSFFNASPGEYQVIFTRGATEALKLLAETFDFQTNGHFMYLRHAHNSVVGMRAVVKTKNVHVMEVDGFLSLQHNEPQPATQIYSLSNSLVVFPAQCNFNGFKYPLQTIDVFHQGHQLTEDIQRMSKNWYVCVDAANFVSTSRLDLSQVKPDFVALSFYKLFGYPTGLGALLVSRRGQQVLQKVYHGGGTVEFALSNVEQHRKKIQFHERFEDGTLPFLSIISLMSGFETLNRLVPPEGDGQEVRKSGRRGRDSVAGLTTMERISWHVFRLAKYLYDQLKELKYPNGQPLIRFYNQTEFQPDDKVLQGGIVTFNVHRWDGEMAGYKEIEALAEMNDIYLRVGCFCNPGACQTHLEMSTQLIMQLEASGHSCNGSMDVMDSQPFGFVRISVGYVTGRANVDAFLRMLVEYFMGVIQVPDDRQLGGKMSLLQMRVYPVREAAPLILSFKWELEGRDQLIYENHWSVVNEFGVLLTAKNYPQLSRLRVLINQRKQTIRLIYPQRNHIDVDINEEVMVSGSAGQKKKLGFENQPNMEDCGDQVAEWLQDVLQVEKVRLNRKVKEDEENNKRIVPVDSYFTKNNKEASMLRVLNFSGLLEFLADFYIEPTDPVVEEFIQAFRPHFIVYGGVDDRDWNESGEIRLNDMVFKVMCKSLFSM